jgi:O-antigen/teichoic acid export membrane protein
MRIARWLRPASAGIRGQVLWGLVDQGCFSATNFGLTVVAARELGPEGVGAVYIGFTIYLVALGLLWALIADPLVVSSAALVLEKRQRATRAATTATLTLAAGSALVAATAGMLLPSGLGRGLVLFAPWIVPALLRDLFRTALFRDQRGAVAACTAVAWVGVMIVTVTLTLVWDLRSDWAVVGSWGLGVTASAALGLASTRAWPERPVAAWRWWHTRAWPLGRWLGAESVLTSAQTQVMTLLLAGVLGVAELGGLRAAQSLFALMTLVGPGLAIAMLPATRRSLETSVPAALALATRMSVAALSFVVTYLAAIGGFRDQVMVLVFGKEFEAAADLVIPIGVAQLLTAASIGFTMFLKACSEGRKLFWMHLTYAASLLALTVSLALYAGVQGAAWGFTLASAVGSSLAVFLAFRVAAVRGRRQPAADLPAARHTRSSQISRQNG